MITLNPSVKYATPLRNYISFGHSESSAISGQNPQKRNMVDTFVAENKNPELAEKSEKNLLMATFSEVLTAAKSLKFWDSPDTKGIAKDYDNGISYAVEQINSAPFKA